jgi:TRL-like protein family
MKKMMAVGCLVVAGMISGCATAVPVGMLYTEVKLPQSVTSNTGRKEGTAECTSVLSLIATGDCSIQAAMKKGGISKISHVDWEAKSILGIFGEYRVHVFGE